ncbi:unnamed protein product [Heligmosomoides polygyrus]|uniref:TSC-22/dip/bun family protein n=1 Tax=Heligmosomoides polygyrus TaxID=6339 RepID=A0A183G984_HELPZ|nr:unnamed protein product [Heligmosomoides polygyrus]
MSTSAAVIRANGAVKRFCPDTSPIPAPRTVRVSIADALKEVNDSTAVPLCVKTAFNTMMEELKVVREERDMLFKENLFLRKKLGLPLDLPVGELGDHDAVDSCPPRSTPPTVPTQSGAEHEIERRRSIIISGVPELADASIERRVRYDMLSVHNILFHIGVECLPVSVYRLGRPTASRNRLLKVIFPCSFFQRLAIRRASRLRTFPEKGVYIRASLTQEERARRREAHENISHSQAVASSMGSPTPGN